ncbi:MAG: glycosyltransferase [Coriobacteriales bacterium]
MSNAKIAVVTQAVKLADETAGLNRTSYIAELLAREGYEVDLLTSTFQHWEKKRRDIADPKYHELPYEVIFIEEPGYGSNINPKRIYSQSVFSKNLRRYLERYGADYDLVWCQIPPNNIAADAGTFAHERNIPFVVDINDLWPEAMKMVADVPVLSDFALSDFERDAAIAYACASAAVGTSHEYAHRCLQDIPHLTVYVGGDIAYFDEGVKRYAPSIAKNDDELWIAYAGSLARSYDVATLVRACQLAAPIVAEELGKKLSLYIMGDGPNRPGLERLADEIDAPVVFTGYVDYQIMAAYLVASDILVNSLIKGAPQSIVSKIADYLCAGRPIINTGESQEFKDKCTNDGFGVNVEPEDVAELVGAIVALAHDEEARDRMGKRGRAIAEEQFDRPVAYREIVDLVGRLLEDS